MKIRSLNTLTASIIVTLSMTTTISHADNYCGDAKTIFACQTKNHKQVTVCQDSNTLTYRYGSDGNTELNLKRQLSDVIKTPWNGVGYSIHYSLGFQRGSTVYSVFASQEREVDGDYSAGIEVFHKGKYNYLHCQDDDAVDNMQDLL